MSNELKMEKINSLKLLYQRGLSKRRIAKELGIHRETVSRHLSLSDPPKPAKVTTGSSRTRSRCEEHRAKILEMLEEGLSATRIHQDLVKEEGFEGGYESVKRFVRKLRKKNPLPFRKMETNPGAEGQVDFGQRAFIVGKDGKRRPPTFSGSS
ncbi:MAG TPA: hypothetical protein ENK02_10070 [Planctomycetes bacterium]|nr:hypothetical protein [Planctomycetota bacterium]